MHHTSITNISENENGSIHAKKCYVWYLEQLFCMISNRRRERMQGEGKACDAVEPSFHRYDQNSRGCNKEIDVRS